MSSAVTIGLISTKIVNISLTLENFVSNLSTGVTCNSILVRFFIKFTAVFAQTATKKVDIWDFDGFRLSVNDHFRFIAM